MYLVLFADFNMSARFRFITRPAAPFMPDPFKGQALT
jgi:hypothetical protein